MRAVHNCKAATRPPPNIRLFPPIATKLTISEFHAGVTDAIPATPHQPRRHGMERARSNLRRLLHYAGAISVRTRIVLLALIPLVGFLANGVTFISGEGGVSAAFHTAERARQLADA